MEGPAIPALVLLPILLVSVLSSSVFCGWLSRGDLALESNAHFLAIAEHRLVPARVRTVHHSASLSPSLFGLGTVFSGCHSWWPCWGWRHQSSWRLPFSSHPFRSRFQGVLSHWSCHESVLPLGNGGVVHLFVIYGYQGAESDPEKLQLSEYLFAAVLAEARMCCAGQPVILVGDF